MLVLQQLQQKKQTHTQVTEQFCMVLIYKIINKDSIIQIN